jgi:hypothetical protein
VAEFKYNLKYGWDLRDFFMVKEKDYYQHNLFYYPQMKSWLDTCREVVKLENQLFKAIASAREGEKKLSAILNELCWPFTKLLLDDIVLGASMKAGYDKSIPWVMLEVPGMPSEVKVALSSLKAMVDLGEDKIKSYFKLYSEYRKAYEKDVAKESIKTMSVAWLPYRGLQRKRLRLEHNFQTMESMFINQLYIPTQVIRSAVHDAVFKGAWDNKSQRAFNDIYKVTVANRTKWSEQARSTMQEWQKILTDYKYVSDNIGKKMLEIVEIGIHQGGGVAA